MGKHPGTPAAGAREAACGGRWVDEGGGGLREERLGTVEELEMLGRCSGLGKKARQHKGDGYDAEMR